MAFQGTTSTSKYYVDGVKGDDLSATGNLERPYKTIQACLDFLGQPISARDFKRHIEIYISDSLSAPVSGSGWNAIYTENLVFPHRSITVYGCGVKIDGTVTREISDGREWGTSSSDFRGCLTFMGLLNCRDSHNRLRNGFHIGGAYRTKVINRNISSIVGDGVNHITVAVASAYQIDVGIRIVVRNTVNYNGLYDITTKNSSTQFIATRVSGTNASVVTEVVGDFFESDVAGASGSTHDSAAYNTYLQGQVSVDDGTNNGGALTTGGHVMYLENCRVYTGIDGTGIAFQRIINNEFTGALTLSSMVSIERNVFSAAISTATFTYSTTDMHWMNNQFSTAVAITVRSAGQTFATDAFTYADFLARGCSWITNTPTIVMLDNSTAIGYTPAVGANWTDPDPTTVAGALDRIAAAVVVLKGSPI